MTLAEINAAFPDARQLSSRAKTILISLPAEVRPLHSASVHPWMLDRLLDKWNTPAVFRSELNDLLIDTRGGRKGFDFDTLTELTALGDYYNSHVHPLQASGWATVDPR